MHQYQVKGYVAGGSEQRRLCPRGVWGPAQEHLGSLCFPNVDALQTPSFGVPGEASSHSMTMKSLPTGN